MVLSDKLLEFDNLFRQFSRAEAESILEVLYQKYFERELDDDGRRDYTPYIENFGFWGIAWITYHLVKSKEMNGKVKCDLEALYKKHLYRDPDDDGKRAYDKWIRFFGEFGKRYVENSILKSEEYGRKH
jgi:hypothetical protein